MKKIRLTYNCITINNNSYQVLIGDYNNNDLLQYRQFSSNKLAENFIKKTNKFLTDVLHEINMLYARVHYEYRVNWAVIADNSTDKHHERFISNQLEIVSDNLNKIASASNAQVKHVGLTAFRLFNLCCSSLSQVIDYLIEVNQKRSQTNLVYSYKFLLNDIIKLKSRINNYNTGTELYINRLPKKEPVRILTKTIIDERNNNTLKQAAKPRKSLSRRKANSNLLNAATPRAKQPKQVQKH